jgi:SAM-dependent methyltransferase
VLGLTPYSARLADRLTARHTLSLELVTQTVAGQPQTVLDVGCSNGWLEHLLAATPMVDVTGVDVDAASLDEARRNATRARFQRATALDLPFPNATFDGAVMFEVIEHVPARTEPRALAEVRRVLKSGAWFILSTPNAHPVATALDPAWYLGHRHYSSRALERLLTDSGFRVEWQAIRGGFWEIGGMFALYAFKWLLKSEVPGREAIERGRKSEFLDGRRGFTHHFLKAVAV